MANGTERLADVVPVVVPYPATSGCAVTVPADTHLLHCGILWPGLPESDDELTSREREINRYRSFRSLVHDVEWQLTINGAEVSAVADVVRSDGDRGMDYWNITDPLPCGTHTATLSLTFTPEDPIGTPLVCATGFEKNTIDLTGNQTVELQTTVTVVSTERDTLSKGVDPLWDRRTVYYPQSLEQESVRCE